MLSASILYFAATRPAPAPGAVSSRSQAAATVAAVTPTPQEVQQQIQQAVSKAVAEVEARQAKQTKQLVAYIERQNVETLRSVRWMAGELDANRKRSQVRQMAMYVQPGESGEVK
jgi:D-aminopeptidase